MVRTDPSRKDVQARGEHIHALAVVGEVGALVTESRSADGDGLLGSSGGVVASVPVVITGSDCEMKTGVDSTVDGLVESSGLSSTKRHVGDGALVLRRAGSLELSESSGSLLHSGIGSENNTGDDIGHGAGAVGTEDLDSDDVSCLSNSVLPGSDGTGTVSTVTVVVLINIVLWDGLAPGRTTLELSMVDVDTGVDDVDVDALTTVGGVLVASESTESKPGAVADTCETLKVHEWKQCNEYDASYEQEIRWGDECREHVPMAPTSEPPTS